MKQLLIIANFLFLLGCDVAKSSNRLPHKLKINPDGIRYVIACIEGQEYVATQTSHGYWSLGGRTGNQCKK